MKISKLCLLLATSFLIIGCSKGNGSSNDNNPSDDSSGGDNNTPGEYIGPVPTFDEDSISIHYHREDGKYTGKWDLWVWEQGGDGAQYIFNASDDFGAVAAYPLSTWSDVMTKGLGVIIRSFGAWNKQTPDIKLNLNEYQKDENNVYNFYFEQGANDIYDGNIYTTPNTEGISVAEFTNETSVAVIGSKEMSKVVLKENGQAISTKELEEPSKQTRINLPSGKTASFENSYENLSNRFP